MKQSNNKKSRDVTAFLYERLSRDDNLEGESYSIGNQKKLLAKVAKEKGYTNLVHFLDDGISGVTMDRPGFVEMICQLEQGKAAAVFVKDLSRLGRNYIEVGRLTEEFFPKTCERIAQENHVSASAVRRAALFAAGVDLAEELCPGIRQRVLSGDLKAPDALFERLAKARPEDYDALLEQIKNPQSRAKPAAKQKLFQTEKSSSSEPMLAPHQGESKLVPEEASSLYSQLADASTAMQERWGTIFKQMPTLLTDSEQRKAVQVILEKHLAYLAALGFDLSGMTESKREQSA